MNKKYGQLTIEQIYLKLEERETIIEAMNKFYKNHKQWFIDYPKVIQPDRFSDDIIDLFSMRREK